MNTSYKVVFNKARGALMVVNEITSSVQAKGTKTVIAATVACLVSGTAIGVEYKATNNQTVNVGSDDTSYIVTELPDRNLGVYATQGGKLNILGKNIQISATGIGSDKYGKSAVYAVTRGSVALGNSKTESVDINAERFGIWVYGKLTDYPDSFGKIDVVAKKISINANEIGVMAQHNTDTAKAPDPASSVSLTADDITVTAKEIGFAAFSNSQISVNGNLTVTAPNALDVRGNSTTKINVDGKHTTVINGDIVFETPATPKDSHNSGKIINA